MGVASLASSAGVGVATTSVKGVASARLEVEHELVEERSPGVEWSD